MEIKSPKIKGIKYEDFKDNEYIDSLVAELNAAGANIVVGKLDQLMQWGHANSLWPFCFGTSCCAIEFMCLGAARYDMARFGFEVARNSPRQSDYIMCQGTITYRMAPALVRLYEQMAEPKYVIACGGCTVSGGPFKKSYCVGKGVDEIIPVDVYMPGCPPRPSASRRAISGINMSFATTCTIAFAKIQLLLHFHKKISTISDVRWI